MEERSDAQLVAAYLKGEEAAFTALVNRHLKAVYGFVLRRSGDRATAEDVSQEAFVKAWRNLRRFDRKKKFLTWILAIANNSLLDSLKKKKPVPFTYLESEDGGTDFADTLRDESPLPPELFERKDLAEAVNRAMARLAPEQEETVRLYHQGGLTFSEISQVMGKGLDTVKTRYYRALAKLRQILTGKGG